MPHPYCGDETCRSCNGGSAVVWTCPGCGGADGGCDECAGESVRTLDDVRRERAEIALDAEDSDVA